MKKFEKPADLVTLEDRVAFYDSAKALLTSLGGRGLIENPELRQLHAYYSIVTKDNTPFKKCGSCVSTWKKHVKNWADTVADQIEAIRASLNPASPEGSGPESKGLEAAEKPQESEAAPVVETPAAEVHHVAPETLATAETETPPADEPPVIEEPPKVEATAEESPVIEEAAKVEETPATAAPDSVKVFEARKEELKAMGVAYHVNRGRFHKGEVEFTIYEVGTDDPGKWEAIKKAFSEAAPVKSATTKQPAAQPPKKAAEAGKEAEKKKGGRPKKEAQQPPK
jgi:hypothetical protein